MKKKLPIILIGIILTILIIIGVLYITKKDNEKTLSERKEDVIPEIVLNDKGSPIFIDGSETKTKVSSESDVYKALNELKDLYGFTDAQREFNVISTSESMGFKFYKVNQKINNVAVYGKQLVLSVNDKDEILSITGNYYRDLKVNNRLNLTANEAEETLTEILSNQSIIIKESNKYVYIASEDEAYYVYIVTLFSEEGYIDYIINAEDGTIIDKVYKRDDVKLKDINDNEQDINLQLVDGEENLYHFYDDSRNIMIADVYGTPNNVGTQENINWINFIAYVISKEAEDVPFEVYKNEANEFTYKKALNSEEDHYKVKTAVSAMVNFSKTYDYYKNVLERNSYNDKGAQIIANIGLQYDLISFDKNNEHVNASWNGGKEAEFYFGSYNGVSFAAGLDIVAHEFTHAVTEYTSGLVYKDESGALNEAYSDIMGSLVEGDNFIIGEDVLEMRDMTNPNRFNDPAEKGGKYYFPDDTETYDNAWKEAMLKATEEAGSPLNDWTEWDNGGVHTNSSVPNHAAYLMYKNGAFKDKKEMAKVWYLSMNILTKTSNFEDCALAVLQAAKMQGLTEEKIKIIEDAFVKTKMLELDNTTVSGTVTDAESKEGIELALVTLISKKNIYINYSTQADEKGNYNFEKIPAGEYTIIFEKAKYKSTEKEISLEVDSKDKIDISLEKIDDSDTEASDIIFVLDISSSMTTSDPSDIRKQMIVNVIATLQDDASVALVTFARNAKVINNGLSYKQVNKKILMTDIFNIANDDGTTNNSGTNGRMGLSEALSLFNKNKDSRKYIVFFTDGEDTYDDGPSYDELIKNANDMNVRILTVGLNASGEINQTELKKLADATKGKYYFADDSSDLYGFDVSIFEELE